MMRNITWVAMVLLAGLLSGCVGAGVASFSPSGEWSSVVDGTGLWVQDKTGTTRTLLTADVNPRYPPVFVNEGQDLVYVNGQQQISKIPRAGGTGTVLREEPVDAVKTALILMPNGQILVVEEIRPNENRVQVLDPQTGQVLQQIEGIAAIFPTANSFWERPTLPGSSAAWYVPNLFPDQLKLVLQSKDVPASLYLYTADSNGFSLVQEIPRKLSEADRALLAAHEEDDWGGAVLTPAGDYLILRTKEAGTKTLYDLWVLDLRSNTVARNLVQDAGVLPRFALHPAQPQIAYQVGDGAVNLTHLNSSVVTTLPQGARLELWR